MNVHDLAVGSLPSVKVLTYKADFATGVDIRHRFPSRVYDSEVGQERRGADGESMILHIAYEMLMTEAEAEEMRNLIGGLDEGYYLGIPLWPDAWPSAEFAAKKRYNAQYIVNFTEGTGASIHTSVPVTPTYSEIAPIMVGKLTVEPRWKAVNETKGRLRIVVEEDSPYSHRIEPVDFTASAIFPATLVPNWTSEVSEISKNGIRRTQIADLRQQQEDGFDWAFRYERAARFSMNSDDIGTLLDFWYTKKGRVTSFDGPAWFAAGTPTANAPHGFKSRFDSENLTISYLTRGLAEATIRLITLPWESAGSSTNEIEKKVRLFKFVYESPTPVTKYYTDHEYDLTNTEATWISEPFELLSGNAIDLKLTAKAFKVRSFSFSGNPIDMFIPYQPDAAWKITIMEAPLSALNSTVVLHEGYIDEVSADSRELLAEGRPIGASLDSPFPRFRVGHRCNYTFGGAACGVNLATYKETGTISAISGRTITVDTSAADADNYFAGGKMQIGDGLTFERRSIVRSTEQNPIPQQQVFEIDRPLVHSSTSDSVEFWPACDKTYTGGCTRYGNKDRFGGAPFMPEPNLVIEPVPSEEGGKK